MVEDIEIMLEFYKESRNCINHLDKMMDGIRVRLFTLFGTLTSIAAALYYWAPNVFIANIRLSALVELSIILVLIPSIFQNRLYHFWLFKAINTSLSLENLIFQEMKKKDRKMDITITHALTGLEERAGSYWKAMWHSKLFWVEMLIFSFMILTCVAIFYVFLLPTP